MRIRNKTKLKHFMEMRAHFDKYHQELTPSDTQKLKAWDPILVDESAHWEGKVLALEHLL